MAAAYIDINQGLVDRCRNGEGKAQYEIYGLYARQMYNVCMRIVNHAADAEDILQEAFVEAFRYIHEFRGESSFGAWLKKIVVNRAINHLKKRRLTLFETIPGIDQLTVDEQEGQDENTNLEVIRVHKAIMELPTGYRLVLCLYLVEGYDHGEIAQILNITESTSKSQYNRAKTKLREQLKLERNER